jgi:uncharacterized protein (DUF3820 family)
MQLNFSSKSNDEIVDLLMEAQMPYGKHKGERISYLVCAQRNYINWLYEKLEDEDLLKIVIDILSDTIESGKEF